MRAGRHSPVRLRRIRPQSRTVACRRETTEPRRAPERRISSLPCHIARNPRIRLEERRTQCFPCRCRRNTNPRNPQTPLTSTPNQRSSSMPPDADWRNGATRRTMVPLRAAPEYPGVYSNAAREVGDMEYCPHCGAPYDEGSRFCFQCGAPRQSAAGAPGAPAIPVLLRYRPLRYPCRAMATWRRSHRFHRLREHPRRHPTMVLPHSQRMRAMPAHLRPSPPETPPRHRPIPPDPPPRSRPPSAHE